ncbi:MAG: hypothetical protein VX252_17090, partial [Myxococcota bacterium]|nr:hypothetical protein [Myxococcota bacterium]
LGPDSLQEVLDAYNTVYFELGDFEFEMLATWWARFDPQAAFDYTRTYWEANSYSVPQAVLRQWATQDPHAAMQATLMAGASPEVPDPFINAVITGWDESGHPGLYEFVYQLGPGFPRQRALMHLAQRQVRRNGVEATMDWAENLPSEGRNATLKLNAFRRVAAAAAQVDPQAATAFARKHYHSPYGGGVPSWVGRRWSFYEPEAAMLWLSTLPEGKNRDRGVADTYMAWLRRDRDTAMNWASQQNPEDDWFQPALSTYARQLSLSDRERALELAAYVDHPDYRLITIGRIVRSWLYEDRIAARRWLKNSDLSMADRARILSQELESNPEEASTQTEEP